MAEMQIKVADIQQLTTGIKKFEFEAVDGGELPEWQPGAHLIFVLDAHLHNSYSLSGDPTERGKYVTAVLREENGAGGSKHMHDKVSVGDVLTVQGPNNNFPLAEDAKSHLLIAGGIGITPMLAMGRHLKASGANVHLHYCTKSPEETAYMDEVKAVFGDDLTFHHDGGDPANGIKLGDVLKTPADGAHLYICGPGGLLNAAREAASHWPDGSVHFELFASAKAPGEAPAAAPDGDHEFEIELKVTGKTFTVPTDKTIMEVLWDNDVEVMYACEEGWCGNCKTGLLGGAVDHRDEYLDDAERENHIQVCISRAAPGETKLILDI
ncbi:MAG: oxidoreductase [Rhodospirillaceae bacterium]|nr:oxidoreductase [Rhodospirillaceae bacterium]MBT4718706.1 oxidoreductase [Rhodospirillaceae bacterium]MBT4749698.1 oxidoreductase [Rhodospirillaceae bacterium]MBT5180126.1 oxidoreductase [Rhodospirillaceae bacterium]MBT6292911.1 oxidoreductase [Rhodospirillaceae bacterium]